jgi:CheY-like chemotaxis protein
MVHAISIANNGKETVAQFQEKEFDLVLMDVQMPIISGVEAIAEIKKKEVERDEKVDNSHIPIIALTANAMKKSYQWPDFFEIPQYHITNR